MMNKPLILASLAALSGALAFAAEPAAVPAQAAGAALVQPPANARHFVIQSTGGKHGDSWMWTTADGTHMGREQMDLRGQVWNTELAGKASPEGLPLSVVIRGVSPQGDVGETFTVAGDQATWRSPIDSGSAAWTGHAFYGSVGGPAAASNGWLLEQLLASPTKSLELLPGGRASAELLTSIEVGSGAARQKVNLWAVSGVSSTPFPLWADAANRFFAADFGLAWLPADYAGEQQRLEAAQAAAMAARTAELAHSLKPARQGPVAFVNARIFDAEKLRFVAGQTVVVDHGKITAVGPAKSTRAPAGALLVPADGMTLVPGLWDCHMHVGDDYTGVQELSMGVTSVRDPGNNDLQTMERRKRVAEGALLMPHVHASSLIDGKGPYTAQVANVATSQEEAIALVDKARANGFEGVKFYGTFNKDWLPAAIAEAHKQGLHVHGHIPVGLRTLEAINDGYDEVTHINWIIMQAMPDSVIAESNGIQRFEGPGRYGRSVDLDGAAMKSIIATMAKRHIYSDPTMVAFEALYVPENGDLAPAYAPFVGTLPPTIERGFRAGGFAVPKDLTRADYRASWKKMVELLGRMHKAGIPIVAGTDGSGIEIIHELEIYVQAGFTPAEALAAATLVPAKLVGADSHTGSIAVGKDADLALIDGDPSRNVSDLRHTRMVMLGGQLMDADSLRTAAGFSGRPL
jgi:imidazolonepropionase-like amidohydrolase